VAVPLVRGGGGAWLNGTRGWCRLPLVPSPGLVSLQAPVAAVTDWEHSTPAGSVAAVRWCWAVQSIDAGGAAERECRCARACVERGSGCGPCGTVQKALTASVQVRAASPAVCVSVCIPFDSHIFAHHPQAPHPPYRFPARCNHVVAVGTFEELVGLYAGCGRQRQRLRCTAGVRRHAAGDDVGCSPFISCSMAASRCLTRAGGLLRYTAACTIVLL